MADKPENPIPGGPFAFPWVTESISQMCPGMSLRDWFAATAPITLQIAAEASGLFSLMDIDDERTRKDVLAAAASLRYQYADAMLAEREQA